MAIKVWKSFEFIYIIICLMYTNNCVPCLIFDQHMCLCISASSITILYSITDPSITIFGYILRIFS